MPREHHQHARPALLPRARHTHRHGGISLPRVPPRGTGAVNSPAGLGTGQPRFAEPSRVGTQASADRGPRRPAQALTQTKPNPPPPRGGTSAPTARARRKGARRRHGEGQKGVPQAAAWSESTEAAARHPPPPPPPPHQPASRGGPGPHPPRQGGWAPAAREGSGSVTRPPAPATGSRRGREEQAGPRLRTGTPHRSYPEKPGEHEPEWYGRPRPPWTAQRQ